MWVRELGFPRSTGQLAVQGHPGAAAAAGGGSSWIFVCGCTGPRGLGEQVLAGGGWGRGRAQEWCQAPRHLP